MGLLGIGAETYAASAIEDDALGRRNHVNGYSYTLSSPHLLMQGACFAHGLRLRGLPHDSSKGRKAGPNNTDQTIDDRVGVTPRHRWSHDRGRSTRIVPTRSNVVCGGAALKKVLRCAMVTYIAQRGAQTMISRRPMQSRRRPECSFGLPFERRRSLRLGVNALAHIQSSWSDVCLCKLIDLSISGARVMPQRELAGSGVELTIGIADGQSISLTGTIVDGSRTQGRALGLQFDYVPAYVEDAIQTTLLELLEHTVGQQTGSRRLGGTRWIETDDDGGFYHSRPRVDEQEQSS